MLKAGDRVPEFDLTSIDGRRVRFSEIWQRKNLLWILLPDDGSAASANYTSPLAAQMPELTAHDTVCLITRGNVSAVPPPGVLIADRWGEIVFATHVARAQDLPTSEELIGWLRYVRNQCPECEGEAR